MDSSTVANQGQNTTASSTPSNAALRPFNNPPNLLAAHNRILQDDNAHLRTTEEVINRGLRLLAALDDQTASPGEIFAKRRVFQDRWEQHTARLDSQRASVTSATPGTSGNEPLSNPQRMCDRVNKELGRRRVYFGTRIFLVIKEDGLSAGDLWCAIRDWWRETWICRIMTWGYSKSVVGWEKTKDGIWLSGALVRSMVMYLVLFTWSSSRTSLRYLNRTLDLTVAATCALVAGLGHLVASVASLLVVLLVVAQQLILLVVFGVALYYKAVKYMAQWYPEAS